MVELLIALAAGGIGFLSGKFITVWEAKKYIKETPKKMVGDISKSIDKALNGEDEMIYKNVGTLLDMRDSLRDSVASLERSLNSELDKLAIIFDEKGDPEAIKNQLNIVQKHWGKKSVEIENAIRSVLKALYKSKK